MLEFIVLLSVKVIVMTISFPLKWLLVCNVLFISLGQAQTPGQQKKTRDSLIFMNGYHQRFNNLLLENKLLMEQTFNAERRQDSLQVLLSNVRYRERFYQETASRLKGLYKNSRHEADSLQRVYNELSSKAGSTLTQYKKQVKKLTAERNELIRGVRLLQEELGKPKNTRNGAVFALTVRAVPGELRRKRFSASSRARNSDRIQISFLLNRIPAVDDIIAIKLFDATNRMIPLKPVYHNSFIRFATARWQFIVEPATDARRKFSRGNYSIRLFLINAAKEDVKQNIGIAEFSLR